jgi:hypothetical protein
VISVGCANPNQQTHRTSNDAQQQQLPLCVVSIGSVGLIPHPTEERPRGVSEGIGDLGSCLLLLQRRPAYAAQRGPRWPEFTALANGQRLQLGLREAKLRPPCAGRDGARHTGLSAARIHAASNKKKVPCGLHLQLD